MDRPDVVASGCVPSDQVVRPHDLGSAERLEQIVATALGTG